MIGPYARPLAAGDARAPRPAAALLSRPWLLAVALCATVALLARVGPDWPAQDFRARLAHDAGLTMWNDQWYGGHPLAGYSVLFPLVAGVLGPALTGVLAAVSCSVLLTRLLPPLNAGQRLCNLSAAVCVAGSLFLGQVPFLLGVALALAAMQAARSPNRFSSRWRPLLVAVLAAAASLASPLAGFFLLLVGVAWMTDLGSRRSLPFAGAGAGSLVSVIAGGSSGPFPFPLLDLMDLIAFAAITLVLVPRASAPLRRFVIVYATVGVALFLVPNPIGGNVTRLGQLFAAPAAFWLLTRRRAWFVVGLAAIPAAFWQFYPVASAAARASGDPSVSTSYYDGLLRFLATQDPRNGRLEIPFTREHWEAARVAPYFPIARGWERQTDYEYDTVLYSPLNAASYRSWLSSAGVALVALPDAPLDPGGRAEQALLSTPPSYLVPVWRDAHWRVWRVEGAAPLASGAVLTALDTSSFALNFHAAGEAVVRVRESSLWEVSSGPACVVAPRTGDDGWVHIRATGPGQVVVRARLDVLDLLPPFRDRCP